MILQKGQEFSTNTAKESRMKAPSNVSQKVIQSTLSHYFNEDDLNRHFVYLNKLPSDEVDCVLKIKSDLILAGLPFFCEAFNHLMKDKIDFENVLVFEGHSFFAREKSEINFRLPFSVALSAERVALNLLQHASSIATYTAKFVEKAKKKGIQVIDTRKTLPGLRLIEKYAVTVGGGFNHRYGQTDMWMIKDNHKTFFGSLAEAVSFFRSLNQFYTPLLAEIHEIEELKEAIKLNVKHVMLDNFEPQQIREATKLKPSWMTFEVSGGIRLENTENYLIEGVDAISVGAITNNAPAVDLSMKIRK